MKAEAEEAGRTLKSWREQAGLSHSEVAERLNCSTSVILGIEAGLLRIPASFIKLFGHIYSVTETEISNLCRLRLDQES
jgi:predicted transcriptional regulator